MIATGTLTLVVGPSGAGKDTLIAAARDALAGDQRFVFCRRIITRAVDAASEDHETLDHGRFIEAERAGQFFLSWHAHGLGYALPSAVNEALSADRIVIANVSRAVIEAAEARARDVVVYSVTAPADILAERLVRRGRELPDATAARLARSVGVATSRAPVIEIENAGAVADAVAVLVASLISLPHRPSRAQSAL